MNVFGLDLSITAAGFAPDDDTTETVGGPARAGDGRLLTIENRLRFWLRRRTYALAVIEGPGFASTRIFSVAMVHGVVRKELIRAGIPYAEVAPATLHAFATGDGNATKQQMMQTAEGLAGRKFHDDNQADAWWLRRMGLAALGDREGLAPDQVERLGVVQWPSPVESFALIDSPRTVLAQCKHRMWCLRNGDHWLHPFTLDRCSKPPK